MTDDSFLTIAEPSKGLYREKGSKFLSFAWPVVSETEIKALLDDLKKEYYDARHHCYAYLLGPDKLSFRAYDAGEPPHTAGDPILNQIRSAGIVNVLVAVVRYFGGTKLGKSGLIAAYKEAAQDALRNARVIEAFAEEKFSLKFPYSATGEVMSLLNQLEAAILTQSYGIDCRIELSVRKSRAEEAKALLDQFL